MVIVTNDENYSNYEKLGTIAIFKERLFYPSNFTITDLFEKSLIEHCKPSYLMIPSVLQSDLSDFSMYDFEFVTSDQKDYPTLFLPNHLDNITLNELKGSDFDKVVGSMLPQSYITNTDESLPPFSYFGRLNYSSKNIYLIKIPKDMWRVDVYNTPYLSKNYEMLDGTHRSGFLDYSLLLSLKSKSGGDKINILEKPLMTIYFGPRYETRLSGISYSELFGGKSDYSFYIKRYYTEEGNPFSEEEYNNFSDETSIQNYKSEYNNEVRGEKVLYISTDSDTYFGGVDVVTPSYFGVNNPHRYQNEVSLRVDDSRVDSVPVIQTYDYLVDKVSGIFLGRKIEGYSILKNLLPKIGENYYTGRNQEVRKMLANGKLMEKGNSGKYTLNPEISPLWSIPRSESANKYKKVFIGSESNGDTSPTGIVYCKKEKNLILSTSPNIGYYGSLVKNDTEELDYYSGNLILPASDGDQFQITFSKINYRLDFNISGNNLQDLINSGVEIFINENRYTGGDINIRIDEPLTIKFNWSNSGFLPIRKDFLNYSDTQRVKYDEENDFFTLELNDQRIMGLGDTEIVNIIGEITTKTLDVYIFTDSGVQCTPNEYISVSWNSNVEFSFYTYELKRMAVYVNGVRKMITGETEERGKKFQYTLQNITESITTVMINYYNDEN